MKKIVAFLVIAGIFGCSLQTSVKVNTSSEETPVFSLAWSEYVSWSTFGVAHELGILNGNEGEMSELEKKWNIDVVLKEADYDTCIGYYATGTCDAACLTNIDMLPPSFGRPVRAVLPTSTSNGGDAVLSVAARSVQDLKGMEVYGLDKSVSEYCFWGGLESLGENPSDYTFVGLDPSAAAQSLQTDSPTVKAICVWNPYKRSTLENQPKAQVVFDSTLISGEIVDMVGVGEDSMSREGSDRFCACICEAYYEVCDRLNDPATRNDTLVALGAKFSDLNAEQMEICTTETLFYDTSSKGVEIYDGQPLKDAMQKVVKYCVSSGMCESEPVVNYGVSTPDGNLTFDSRFMEMVQ